MELTIWGTRGSYPVCRPDVMRYGGNTTCFAMQDGSEHLIVDGGSGIVPLGRALTRNPCSHTRLGLFLTHPHWDHVLGYPHFAPFYDERFQIDIHGADSENRTLEGIFSTQHQAGNFAVAFRELQSNITLHQLRPGDEVHFASTRVRSIQLNHPGVDLGYRFDTAQASIVVFTDLAPIEDNLLGDGMSEQAEGREKAFEKDYVNALVDFVRGADLVLHDTNFTKEEIVNRRHWGHSTPEDALTMLSHLDHPPALVLTHHDPNHSDEQKDHIYKKAKQEGHDCGVDVMIAREGEVLCL